MGNHKQWCIHGVRVATLFEETDILNFYPIMDQTMYELFEPFSLKYNVSDMNKPGGLSGHLSLLEAGNGIVSEFLLDKTSTGEDRLYSKLKKVNIA